MSFTIGSLFDGSGGFPLSAFMCGGVPVWASEIEPYPIAVTKSRFPYMKHLGSVTDIKGNEVDPVDVITFGSPCQDLSVAGKRAGLKHTDNGDEETTRSGLFMEAVRIIKEMREATNGVYPKFALWENVPGAFSSNKGEDFRVVLEELVKIVEPTAVMPTVPKGGWAYADSWRGISGWSLAYRVLDAQYWGVPQRRRRIYLVLDLRGECAGEILFKRESLRGYFAEGGAPWKSIAPYAERGVGADDYEGVGGYGNPCGGLCGGESRTADGGRAVPYTLKIRSGCEGGGKGALVQEDKSATLATNNDQYLFQPIAVATQQGGAEISENGICPTITAAAGMSGNNQPWICHPNDLVLDDQGGSSINVRTDGKSPTLRAEMHGNVPCVMETAGFCPEQSEKTRGIGYEEEMAPTLRAGVTPAVVCKTWDARGNGDGDTASTITGDHENRITDYTSVVVEPICCIDGDKIGKAERAGGSGLGIREGDKMYTLTAKDAGSHAVCVPIADQATRFSGKRGDKCDGKGNGLGVGNPGDPMNTLTSGDRHAVAYLASGKEVAGCLMASGYEKLGAQEMFSGDYTVIETEREAVAYPQQAYDKFIEDDIGTTLKACGGSYGGGSETLVAETSGVHYIVRRLTPTECARLQGFPDKWGHPDIKETLTDKEYAFWLEVRNTHAGINGKAVKEYTREQMLSWYNKLHTDSAEYKCWGNGIALPCALYVMQGIAEVFA